MLAKIGTVTLADGTKAGGHSIIIESLDASWRVEVSARPGAVHVQTFDRGNSERSFTFSVSRTFASQEEADLFLVEHAGSIDRTKVLQLTSRERGTGREAVRWLRASKLESLTLAERMGVHLKLRYNFRGSHFSETES